jgi:hypothetical protein
MELLIASLMQIGLETTINDIQLRDLCSAWVLMESLGYPINNPQLLSFKVEYRAMFEGAT